METAALAAFAKNQIEPQVLRPYVSGQDLTGRIRGAEVIDRDGLGLGDLQTTFPKAYQHLLTHVLPVRSENPRALKRDRWWIFGENQPGMRNAVKGLSRYIATTETAKHRFFQFLDSSMLAEGTVAVFALDDAYWLGVLLSKAHVT